MSRFAAAVASWRVMMRLAQASSRPAILNITGTIVSPAAAAATTSRHSLLSVDSLARLPFDFSRSYARGRRIDSEDEDEDQEFGEDFEEDFDDEEDFGDDDDDDDDDDEDEDGDENGVPMAMK